jgi:hypothetical protein
MNPRTDPPARDPLDRVVERWMHDEAPPRAPDHLLGDARAAAASTPQTAAGNGMRTVLAGLAAAAVVLLAVLVGSRLPSLMDRGVGVEPSSTLPAGPSPSASPSGSASPSPSASARPSGPAVAVDELALRVVTGCGGPTYPSHLLPTATLMADGTMIWQPIPAPTETGSLVVRSLTPEGLADLRERIFGGGLLDSSATHEPERRPGTPEPPGRGACVHTFTSGLGDDEVVVRAVEWLGDDEESAYYQPAPERQQLDELAQALRDPESLVAQDAWTDEAVPYVGPDYQLVLTPYRDVPPYDTTDVSAIPLPVDGALDEFGTESGDPRPPTMRCGIVTRDQAAAIVDALTASGFGEVGLDRATVGSLDWAEGNGTVDLFLLPRMPDGFPECEDQQL